MTSIAQRYEDVGGRISAAAASSGRRYSDITLVAVAKTFPAAAVNEVLEAGATDVGENRVQELTAKAELVSAPVTWHFVGHLQTNKVRDVVGLVALVHSVDRSSVAAEIAKRARAAGIRQRVLVEVNIASEETKHGLTPSHLRPFVEEMAKLEGIEVCGLMAIPPLSESPEGSRPHFDALRVLRDEIAETVPTVRELSMGMSRDLEVAVEEGATIVRVGEAIFGSRSR